MSIKYFISQLRDGNDCAFRALVADYQQKVFSTAMNLVQDHEAAEDITQEVFVTVFKSVASFNEKSSLSTWVYRITVNKSLDYLRAKKRQKYSLFSQPFGAAHVIENKPGFEHPGILLENREKARYLYDAIETLPANQKTVFVLAHLEELSQKEIADIMSVSVKAVESLLQRAKVKLRIKLAEVYAKEK